MLQFVIVVKKVSFRVKVKSLRVRVRVRVRHLE